MLFLANRDSSFVKSFVLVISTLKEELSFKVETRSSTGVIFFHCFLQLNQH